MLVCCCCLILTHIARRECDNSPLTNYTTMLIPLILFPLRISPESLLQAASCQMHMKSVSYSQPVKKWRQNKSRTTRQWNNWKETSEKVSGNANIKKRGKTKLLSVFFLLSSRRLTFDESIHMYARVEKWEKHTTCFKLKKTKNIRIAIAIESVGIDSDGRELFSQGSNRKGEWEALTKDNAPLRIKSAVPV